MTLENHAEEIAKGVADKCHGDRKPNQARDRYAIIYQAARMGALAALRARASQEADRGIA